MTADFIGPLVPELALFALAVVVLAVGLVRRPRAADTPDLLLGGLAIVGVAGVAALTFRAGVATSLWGGAFVNDPLALFAKRLFLGATALSILASLAVSRRALTMRAPEYLFALLSSALGMLVLASARELVLLFVAFELMSIPLYVLTGFLKDEAVAPEAALKFFLIGAASSAVVVYGMSFVYGGTGTTELAALPLALSQGDPFVRLGLALLLAGLGFKIAAFPFHMWAPDSYEAASTPFVAWLSVAPKAAGFVAIVRLYLEGVGPASLFWMPVVATLAGLTIVAGNLMAIPQQNIKRMLAYSGVAHIGYMLVGLAALSSSGVAMVLFYLVAYLFGNMGAFFVVEVVSQSEKSDGIDAYRGLAQRSPLLALAMLIFLLSLGGIPFVAGFWAKLYVFWAAIDRGLFGLVFLGAVLTVVALYYYLLVARQMYIEAPASTDAVRVPTWLAVAIAICAAGVVGVGLYPEPWVRAALQVAATLFS